MQFLTLFLFFANNSRMEGPIPVFLTYLDLPNGLEGGSTANYFFWIFMLNKVCTATNVQKLDVPGPDEKFCLRWLCALTKFSSGGAIFPVHFIFEHL